MPMKVWIVVDDVPEFRVGRKTAANSIISVHYTKSGAEDKVARLKKQNEYINLYLTIISKTEVR